jgi:hypothetical protein
MKLKKLVTINIKHFLVSFIVLACMVSYSYAAGFYVIPVVSEKEVIKEICHGNTPVGAQAFVLNIGSSDHSHLKIGDIYPTETGYLVEIIGLHNESYSVWYNKGDIFFVAPSNLPQPDYGTKGPFYYMNSGKLVYAHFL